MRNALTVTVILLITIFGFIGCEDDSSPLPPPPDQNPPIAPSNLEGEALSATEIRLTWNDRAENEQGYEIHGSIGDQSNFELIDETDENVISFTLTDKLPATTYYFKVRGFNQGGMGEFSNVTTVTTLEGPPVSPSNLIAEAVSSSQINLTWVDNSDNEVGFKIERRLGSAQIWIEIGQTQEDVSSFQDIDLTPVTDYAYRIRAYNNTGDSEYSDEATATTDDPPTNVPEAPAELNAEAVSSSQINLSWQDLSNNEENFKIERRPEAGGSWEILQQVGADVTTVYDTNLDANTTYYYRVNASNSAGSSAYSNVASATTQEPPSESPHAPFELQAEAISISQIYISWQDSSDNEEGFKIERKTGQAGGKKLFKLDLVNHHTRIKDLHPTLLIIPASALSMQ